VLFLSPFAGFYQSNTTSAASMSQRGTIQAEDHVMCGTQGK